MVYTVHISNLDFFLTEFKVLNMLGLLPWVGMDIRKSELVEKTITLIFFYLSALGRSGNQDFRSSLSTFLRGLQGRNCSQKPDHCK